MDHIQFCLPPLYPAAAGGEEQGNNGRSREALEGRLVLVTVPAVSAKHHSLAFVFQRELWFKMMPFWGVPSVNTAKRSKFQGVLSVLRKPPDGCPNEKLQCFLFSYFIFTPGYPARSCKEQMHRKMKNSWENTYKNSSSVHFAESTAMWGTHFDAGKETQTILLINKYQYPIPLSCSHDRKQLTLALEQQLAEKPMQWSRETQER